MSAITNILSHSQASSSMENRNINSIFSMRPDINNKQKDKNHLKYKPAYDQERGNETQLLLTQINTRQKHQ